MTIAIVTDSTADLPAKVIERYHISVVPNILVMDGESLEDGQGISRQEFYERLPRLKHTPTTASASAGRFQELYEQRLADGCSEIISIHVASALSGVFNAASLAAQGLGHKIQVYDSGQLSLGLGFMVIEAAQAAEQGASSSEILARIRSVQQCIKVVAMLDTLEYVRRSGRVSWARARLGALLDIKPFVELKDGKVSSLGETRTRRKGVERLQQMIEELGPLEQLAILHTNAATDAATLLQNLGSAYLNLEPMIINVTTVIGTHVGPNGLGFAAVPRRV